MVKGHPCYPAILNKLATFHWTICNLRITHENQYNDQRGSFVLFILIIESQLFVDKDYLANILSANIFQIQPDPSSQLGIHMTLGLTA